MKFSRIDWYIVAGLVLASFFVRIPFISYPAVSVFDEGAYATFLSNDVHQIRYFEIHPPLARMIFTSPYGEGDAVPLFHKQSVIGKPFGDFPYVPARKVSVVFGMLIPGLLFILARLFGIGRKYALIAGGAAMLDSLLIVYSRLILPDSILWVFCLLSMIFSLCAVRWEGWRNWFFAFLSGLFVGLAFSVKWTGGIFGVLAALVFVIYVRQWWKIVLLVGVVFVVSIATHLFVWGVYLSHFEGGLVTPSRSLYADLADAISFPSFVTAGTVLEHVYAHTKTSVAIQKNPKIMDHVLAYGYPEKWPLGLDVMNAWQKKGDRQSIRFSGSFPVYTFTFVAILLLIFVTVFRLFARKNVHTSSPSQTEAMLLLGYMVSYLSIVCMAWTRPMFLYHYVPAYFFAVLILVYGLEKLSIFSEASGVLATRAVATLIVLFFLIQSLYTYGF